MQTCFFPERFWFHGNFQPHFRIRTGLEFDYNFNETFSLLQADYAARAITLKEFSNLRVNVISPVDLAVMKCLAFQGRIRTISDWLPDIADLPDPGSRARAGYLLEYAAHKITTDRTKKLKLFSLALMLRPGQSVQKFSLFPDLPQTPATDGLCKEWGLTDGLCRSDILKMIVS